MDRLFVEESSWPWSSATMPRGNSGQALYDFNHLQGLKMIGGSIEAFHNTWNMVVSELETRPDEKLLQYLYYNQNKHFKLL